MYDVEWRVPLSHIFIFFKKKEGHVENLNSTTGFIKGWPLKQFVNNLSNANYKVIPPFLGQWLKS
jgi:hypothetical protein